MYVGIDLATKPEATGVATLTSAGPRFILLQVGTQQTLFDGHDQPLLNLIDTARVTGMDAPFGWPDAFRSFIAAQDSPTPEPVPTELTGTGRPTRRLTDTITHDQVGLTPLAVGANLIGATAMRAVELLAQVREPIPDRTGGPRVIECYPAACLKLWGLPFRGYKGPRDQERRVAILAGLARWVSFTEDQGAGLLGSDHCLDALVCALTAACHHVGHTTVPGTPEQRRRARTEGWIRLPTAPPIAPPHSPERGGDG